MIGYDYQDWKYGYGKPKGQVYDETEASRRFKTGLTMTALFGDRAPQAPDVVMCVELGGDIVVITWLDDLQRPVLEYLWNRENRISETPGNRLHLQRVNIKTYNHEFRLPEGSSTYDETLYLNTDGSYTAYRGRRDEPAERGDGNAPDEVKWMPLPVFGDWEPFLDPDV